MMFLANDFLRFVYGWLILGLVRGIVILLWRWRDVLLDRRLELLLMTRLGWRVVGLLVERLLVLLVLESHSLRLLVLMVGIHLWVLAGRILLLLHVLEPIIVKLDVQLPIGVLFIGLFNDLIADFFIALHHYKCITEPIKCPSCVSLDNPETLKFNYLTSLTSVCLLRTSFMNGSVIERGSCPIYNLLYSLEL